MAQQKRQYKRPQEGHATEHVEHATARTPSLAFLGLAGAAMAGALGLFLKGRKEDAIFVGLWPLAMLVMGNYNKIVKTVGSDSQERTA